MPTRTFTTALPVDLRSTVGPLRSNRYDATIRLSATRMERAWRTPEGPATISLEQVDAQRFEAEAWGPGADWALAQAPAVVGADDDLTGFEPGHPLVERAHRKRPGLRIGRTGVVYDLLVPTILGQKVTSTEAIRSWNGMIRRWGEPAPGPLGLRLPPAPEVVGDQPYWAFHELNVERKRAVTIIEACRRIDRLQEAAEMSREDAIRRLNALPGLGPWTANIIRRVCLGDADAVEIGDFHIKNHVAWNLAGEDRATDERMMELLEPWVGHRGRAMRLILMEGQKAPAYGPRMPVRRSLTPKPGRRRYG